jgi:hypothetical protein
LAVGGAATGENGTLSINMFDNCITYVSTKPSWEGTVRELAGPVVVVVGVRGLLVSLPGVLVVYAHVSWGLHASLILLPGEARGRHLARAPVEEVLWPDVAHAGVRVK